MITSPEALIELLVSVFPYQPPPKPLSTLWAIGQLRSGEGTIEEVAARGGLKPARLTKLAQSDDLVSVVLGEEIPPLDADLASKVRASLGQLTIGNLAERVFEDIYRETVGTSELELKDDRGARGETDYLVLNGQGRQVFRINIKFHGSQFRKAPEIVGLEPEDCFALATYKIHQALLRQDAEHLPYIFVIVGVPHLTGASVGELVPDNLVQLASLPRSMKRVSGVRLMEDSIVDFLAETPERYGLGPAIGAIRGARWFVLSARRAELLLRDKLFERVYESVRYELWSRRSGHALFS